MLNLSHQLEEAGAKTVISTTLKNVLKNYNEQHTHTIKGLRKQHSNKSTSSSLPLQISEDSIIICDESISDILIEMENWNDHFSSFRKVHFTKSVYLLWFLWFTILKKGRRWDFWSSYLSPQILVFFFFKKKTPCHFVAKAVYNHYKETERKLIWIPEKFGHFKSDFPL